MEYKKGYIFGIKDEYQYIFQKKPEDELQDYLKELEKRKSGRKKKEK